MRTMKTLWMATIALVVAAAGWLGTRAAFASPGAAAKEPGAQAGGTPVKAPDGGQIARGEHLVAIAACNDCHTPKIFGPSGPSPDPARLLSGHPQGTRLPPVPQHVLGPEGWGAIGTNDFTAWAGPWGISFAINLTPDLETGIGSWNEAMFIKALRTGKHMGEGRPILPPMPWDFYSKISDDEMRAIFAYLKSLKPISNVVPDPIPPPGPPPKP